MKTFAIGSILLLGFMLVWGQAVKVNEPTKAERAILDKEPRDIIIAGAPVGEWMRIGRIDHTDPDARGDRKSVV